MSRIIETKFLKYQIDNATEKKHFHDFHEKFLILIAIKFLLIRIDPEDQFSVISKISILKDWNRSLGLRKNRDP